jgi:hypothetical protein
MISIGKLNNGFKEMRLNKKEMVNYQNGTLYKISCKDESITDCFVGSTTSHLKMKSRHKSNCNDEEMVKNIITHFIDSFATMVG